MFDDLFNSTFHYMEKFSDTVKDPFGESILADVFEPMLREISDLQKMEEFVHTRSIEITQLTEELRTIGKL